MVTTRYGDPVHRSTRPMDLDSDEGEGNDMAAISMAIVTGIGYAVSAYGAAKQRTQQREQFDTAQVALDETERFNRRMAKLKADRLMPYSRWGIEQSGNIQNAIAREGDIRTTPIQAPEGAFDTSVYTSGPLFDGQPDRTRISPSTRSWQDQPPETIGLPGEERDVEIVGNIGVRGGRPVPTGPPTPQSATRPETEDLRQRWQEPFLNVPLDRGVNRTRPRGTIGDLRYGVGR